MSHPKKTFVIAIFSLLIGLLFLSCQPAKKASSSDGGGELLQGKPEFIPAAGYINGKRWIYKSGQAYRNSRFLIVKLWNTDEQHPCKVTPKTALQIRLKTIPEISELAIGQDNFKNVPVIFFIDKDSSADPANPFFESVDVHANVGRIIIDEILSGPKVLVSGRFEGAFTSSQVPLTNVAGSFIVPLCDENYL